MKNSDEVGMDKMNVEHYSNSDEKLGDIAEYKNVSFPGIHDNRPFVMIRINIQKLLGLLDSGANCSVLGKNCYQIIEDLGGLELISRTGSIRTADGSEHMVNYLVQLPIEFNDRVVTIPTLLVPSLDKDLILGMDFWNAFQIEPMLNVDLVDCAATFEEDDIET